MTWRITQANPAAQLGVGFRYAISRNAAVSLDAAVTYVGGFRTGDTKTGNLGVTDITPHEINDVWRTRLAVPVAAANSPPKSLCRSEPHEGSANNVVQRSFRKACIALIAGVSCER